ncbi:hypothetical protein KEM55_005328 [Ascosphaera atra]|nr:hypothetical protein KEM55_005328 [Ascosphaera atra]
MVPGTATYLLKLESSVPRGTIATILSHSNDAFYKEALRKYMCGFPFTGDPIDMSLRKMLMEVELPKETQEIDRVLQAFAERYHECNPGIFEGEDQAYFIAFSLLILHTDVFNKNNKRKMQKADYVRNTRDGEGIAEEILECFYENISYTPFIHVEDDNALPGAGSNRTTTSLMPGNQLKKKLFRVGSSDHLSKSSKDPIDPYALILEGKLASLRPNLEDVMELADIYNYAHPAYKADIAALHRAFHKSSILQIVSARSRPDAFRAPESIEKPEDSHPGLVAIRVAKVGLLWRKEQKKKRGRSPWQEWGAVLTGSQLYFFRDVAWVKSTLIAQQENAHKMGRTQGVTFKPPLTEFKPDAIMSTSEAVALLDASYKRHKHAFLLVRHGGLEEVFLANSEGEMNEWMAIINYAAAFNTMGVNMRGMIGGQFQGPFEAEKARGTSQGKKQRLRSMSDGAESNDTGLDDDFDLHTTHNHPDKSADSDASSAVLPIDKVSRRTRKVDPCLAEEVSVARREQLSARVQEADEQLENSQKALDNLLRNARHLQILTPIHPRARDIVLIAAGRVAAKIKWARINIWRTKCYRDVLAVDLVDDERRSGSRSFDRAKPLEKKKEEEEEEEEEQTERGEGEKKEQSGGKTEVASRPTTADGKKRPLSRGSVAGSAAASPPAQSQAGRKQSVVSDGAIPGSAAQADASHYSLRRVSSDGQRPDGRRHEMTQPPSEFRFPAAKHDATGSGDAEASPEADVSGPQAPNEESAVLSADETQDYDDDDADNTLLSRTRSHPHHQSLPTPQHNIELRPRTSLDSGSNARLGKKHHRHHPHKLKHHRSLSKTLHDAHYSIAPPKRPSRNGVGANGEGVANGGDAGDAEAAGNDGAAPPALSRRPGGFTLHGRKASVVTFGHEWQELSPERGLMLRKPSHNHQAIGEAQDGGEQAAKQPTDDGAVFDSTDDSGLQRHDSIAAALKKQEGNALHRPSTSLDAMLHSTSDSELDLKKAHPPFPRTIRSHPHFGETPPDSATACSMPLDAMPSPAANAKPSPREATSQSSSSGTTSSSATIRLVPNEDDDSEKGVDEQRLANEAAAAVSPAALVLTKANVDAAACNDDSGLDSSASDKDSLHTAPESPGR